MHAKKKKAGKKVATGTNTHVVSSPCDVLLVPPPPPSNRISAYTLFVSALHVKSFLISTFTYGALCDGGASPVPIQRGLPMARKGSSGCKRGEVH